MEKKILNILILVIFGISFTQGQRICYSCDSAVDPNCATLSTIPIPVTKTCASLTDSCVSAIIGTRTIRGCLAEDITGPCEGALCETCGANNCNGAIFPLDRAQCHRCEGAQCATITNNNNLEVCLNYVEGDSCYSVVTDEDTLVTYRGCHSDPATDLGRQECTRLDAQGYCVSCTGAACNSNAAKVPSQLQCTRCSGDTACRYGQPTDFGLQCNYDVVLGRQEYCYSYVTANNQVTRGCLYDPITNANHLAECEAGEPTCQLCTSSLCNHESYAYHTCYACDGHTDPNCGTLENAWYEPEVCPSGTLDQVGCFVATTDGVPMRGCVSLLNPDEISYCQSTASGCTICTTDNCNGRAPKTCITCDSSTDANCATVANPTALLQYSQQCPSSSAICISRISNGYTQRACSGTGISCTSGNPCWQCDGANCNTDVLPLDRLKCYKCSGAGCADVTTETNLEVCEMYNTNDQCFTVVTDTEVTHRGCYSDPSSAAAKTVCTEHESGSDRCVKCTGEGCNTQVSKTPATLSCIKCTGAACGNSQASTPGQACFGDVLLGRTESCYSYIHDNGNVERGCLYDPNTPAAISNECTNSPGGRCKVCTAGSCNTEEIQVTETCYTCDSGLDPNCESMTGTIQTKQCPIGTVLGCFRSQVDGVVVRGCAGDLKSGEITLCQRGAQCKLCDGNNCNAKVDFQRCYTCNSASSGAACLNLQDGSINQAVCSDYMDTCLTAIGTNGETIRGCRSSFQQTFPTCSSFTCQTCADNYCNQAVFPTSRRLCHQCSGSGACADSLTSTGDSLSICPVYSATDECYSIVSNQAVYRGCTSSNTEGNTLCNAAGNNCVKCSTANGCNSAAAKSAPTLSCVKCAATDVACLWGFSNSVATRCTSDVWLGSQETCFRIPSGSSAIRGCTLDNPTQCPDGSSTCTKCTGNGCNTATYKRQQCLLCSSTTNGQDNCGSEPDEYTAADCSGDDQTYADRGCYVHVDDDGVVRRGCAKDIDNQLLSQCKDADDESCRYCEADGCNDWPAGASAIQAFSAAAVLLIAVAGKFFH